MIKLIQIKADIAANADSGTITYTAGVVDPVNNYLRKVLKPRVVNLSKDLWLRTYHKVKGKYCWHITNHNDNNLSWTFFLM